MEYQVTGHDHWYSDAFLLQRQIGCTLSALVGRRMEQQQLSSFLLMLVVTGPFMLSKAHSSATPDTAGMSGELKVFEGESLRISLFCGQENLNLEKVWCKEELQKGCLNTEPLIFSEPEWRVLTMASNEKVRLGNPKRGCASVHMASVKAEDSGLYWFGLLDGQKIYDLTPVKMVVRKDFSVPSTSVSAPTSRTPSFESPSNTDWGLAEVAVVQGELLSIEGFCGQQHMKTQKVWCKEELLKGCDLKAPVRLLGAGWKYLTTDPNQRVLIRDSRNGCVSLFMSDLQIEDSGIYWFGFLDGWNIIPFKKIKVIVQGLKNNGNVTVTKEHKPSVSRVVQIGIATVAAISVFTFIITLVVLMLTKRNVRVPSRRSGR